MQNRSVLEKDWGGGRVRGGGRRDFTDFLAISPKLKKIIKIKKALEVKKNLNHTDCVLGRNGQ